mmetsp:Transcript_17613/g.45964  ORF Transcript_17613/g.45964 Transcript_17613/m.45964 type:complete len:217 (+) Transcript_17613:371-1021(+)
MAFPAPLLRLVRALHGVDQLEIFVDGRDVVERALGHREPHQLVHLRALVAHYPLRVARRNLDRVRLRARTDRRHDRIAAEGGHALELLIELDLTPAALLVVVGQDLVVVVHGHSTGHHHPSTRRGRTGGQRRHRARGHHTGKRHRVWSSGGQLQVVSGRPRWVGWWPGLRASPGTGALGRGVGSGARCRLVGRASQSTPPRRRPVPATAGCRDAWR